MKTYIKKLARRSLLATLTAALFVPLSSQAQDVDFEDPYRPRLTIHNHLSAVFDSNLFRNEAEESDVLLRWRPQVGLLRKRGVVRAHGRVGVEVGLFQDHSDEDYADFKSGFSVSFPHREIYVHSFVLRGRYDQMTQADPNVGEMVSYDLATGSLLLKYDPERPYSLSIMPSFEMRDYDKSSLTDSESFAVRTALAYEYSEKLDLLVSYRFRKNDTDGMTNLDSEDHFVAGGVEGTITDKLTANLEIGVQERSFDDSSLSSQNSPYAKATANWLPTEANRVVLTALSDFDTTSDNRSIEVYRFSLTGYHQFSHAVRADLGGTIESVDFDDTGFARSDDAYSIASGVTYAMNEDSQLSLRISYSQRDSNAPLHDYDRISGTLSHSHAF